MANNNKSNVYRESSKNAGTEKIEELKKYHKLSEDDLVSLKQKEEELNREVLKSKRALEYEIAEELHKKRVEDLKKEGKHLQSWFEDKFGTAGAINKTLSSATKSLTSAIDESLNKYIGAQQSLAAQLQGSNTSLSGVLNTLQRTLSASTVVKQEKVFDNLGKLINSGIVYNVEQRAFLQTLTQDINSVFDATNGTFTRLIRIQQQDLSANRVAIEYSLQKFLNQNYQTSEYIKTAFNDVSSSLLSAQVALQNTSEALKLESAVQTQLGSMFSGGISQQTVQGLADAINSLGTGDVSNIGSGMSNLLIMAAARAGMDYGQLLNEGVSGRQATTLLNSVVDYLAEMNTGSNVVKSQLGKLFGVDISDIVAASNVGQVQGSVGSDIRDLFGDYSGFLTYGTELKNRLANLKWTFGTNMATSPYQLMSYEVSKLISESGFGDILFSTGDAIKGGLSLPFIGQVSDAVGAAMQIAGIAVNAAPLLPIISSVVGSVPDILSSFKAGSNGVMGLYEALGGRTTALEDVAIKMSQAGVSGSMYIGSGSTNDLISGNTSSLNELTSNVVTVSGDEITWEDNVATITSDVASILELLNTYMTNMNDNLNSIASSANSSYRYNAVSGSGGGGGMSW